MYKLRLVIIISIKSIKVKYGSIKVKESIKIIGSKQVYSFGVNLIKHFNILCTIASKINGTPKRCQIVKKTTVNCSTL